MEAYEKEHLNFVLEHAAECTVLLKSNGKFPLEKPGPLAAFGAGLRYTVKGGTGSGEVNVRVAYTIEQGLERAGFEITSKKWLDAYDEARRIGKKAFLKELKAQAKAKRENVFLYTMGKTMREPYHELALEGEGDTALYVVSRISGEGSDRQAAEGDVKLTKSEIRDILALNRMYERFMLVLNVGGPVDLTPVMEVGNILLLSQLGADNGAVLADILTGRQNPSGHLTTTWASWEDYSREGSFGDWDETRYKEGIYVGYRYFDSFGKKPLFPFGYGLSFTTFDWKVTKLHRAGGCADGELGCADGDRISVRIRVRNTGERAGKEVMQAYLSMPEGRLDKPYQDLVGFAKTSLLPPGGEEEVEIDFRLSDFASYDEKAAAYILERGDYILRVGNSSAATKPAARITLDGDAVIMKTLNCLGKPDFEDIRSERRKQGTLWEPISSEAVSSEIVSSENLISILISAAELPTATYMGDGQEEDEEIDERVRGLSDEELAYLGIGHFNPKGGFLSVIGNAAIHVAGAAGETTSMLEAKGIKPLIMADGPAGLRLCRQYFEDERGAHDASGMGSMPESMTELMNPFVKWIVTKLLGSPKIPKDAVIKEQAATMIPIGTAIAQSFNQELAERFGDLVGREMEMMGVHLWLAPALNIHRSILCGRNFEYFSEDPLVSGLMAAGITRGVQAHKGCGVTIKHYAANNAETNRYCNNSRVSERALREIYLRGFGICVRKTQPHAVMTSYNLLNGIHTAEHKGLIGNVLRGEFGFRGIVMTDWVLEMMTSKRSVYRNSLSNEVARAGGDLFMPGGKKDYERVLKALRDGSLTRRQLEINGSRVLRMIDLLRGK